MEMYFHQQDLNRLRELNEEQLYILNRELCTGASILKGSCMANEQIIIALVQLAETAAKEVACRKRWSPKPSNGRYSTNGITYDTEEYNKWIRDNDNIGYDKLLNVLEKFSFCDDYLSIMRA